jgi:signal peptidase II
MRPASVAWLRAGLVIVSVVMLDQATKRLIERSLVPGEERRLLPGVQLVNARNHGVAFGFLPGHHVTVTVLISAAVLALLAYFLRHSSKPLIWLPTGMLIGGALGNIIDRLRVGSVTDFIKLPLGWPPFNLADAAITFGVLLLVFVVEAPRRETERQTEPGAERS